MPTSPGSARLACGLGALPEIGLPAVGVQAVKTSAWPFMNQIMLIGGNRLKGSLLQRLSIIRGQLLIGFSKRLNFKFKAVFSSLRSQANSHAQLSSDEINHGILDSAISAKFLFSQPWSATRQTAPCPKPFVLNGSAAIS